MSKTANALSLEQSINLLPKDFHPYSRVQGRKKIIKTPKGIVAFRQSSLLACGQWKTSYNEDDIRTEIDYILYALGHDGILALSRDILLSFESKNYKGRWANNGYPIHVFKEDGRYFWQGMNGNTKDLTEYFIPFE